MTYSQILRQTFASILIGLVFVIPAIAVHAQDSGAVSQIKVGLDRAATGYGPRPEPGAFNKVIGNAINVALQLTGVLLLVYLIYGGFVWMTAGGDKGKTETATKIIRNAVIGIIIIALSNVIADYVLTQLLQTVTTTAPSSGVPL